MDVSTSEYLDSLSEIHSLVDGKYNQCITLEMKDRPLPHTFKRDTFKPLRELYSRRIEDFFSVVLGNTDIRLIPQTVETSSRIGYPYLSFAKDKAQLVSSLINKVDDLITGSSVTVLNVRLQPEVPTKKRKFQFAVPHGVFYNVQDQEISGRERYDERLKVIASRTRLVFNYGVENLITQCLDGWLHDCYLKYPSFHHDMYSFPYDSSSFDFESYEEDISHYERCMGEIVPVRAEVIGGLYHSLMQKLLSAPFAIKATDGCSLFYRPKDVVQLGSGLSMVAPLGKEVNAILYAEALSVLLNLPFKKALLAMLTHGIKGLAIAQFGDDSKIMYHKNYSWLKDEIVKFRKNFVISEPEDPPKFLGFVKSKSDKGYINRLSVDSAFKNFFLDERSPGSKFRPFPNYGYFERVSAYKRYGDNDVQNYLDKETKLLKSKGWYDIIFNRAKQEAKYVKSSLPINYVLGKTYLLTREQKATLFPSTLIPLEDIRSVIKRTRFKDLV
jgi:hypothetical protein